MQEIEIPACAAGQGSGAYIDVRESSDYVSSHVPGARSIPMSQTTAWQRAGMPLIFGPAPYPTSPTERNNS